MGGHLEVGTGHVNWERLLRAPEKHGLKEFIGVDKGGKREPGSMLDSVYLNSGDAWRIC
jgi:hypothetical protein